MYVNTQQRWRHVRVIDILSEDKELKQLHVVCQHGGDCKVRK